MINACYVSCRRGRRRSQRFFNYLFSMLFPPAYVVTLAALFAVPVFAQEADQQTDAIPQSESLKVFSLKFLGGMATGFAAHEGSHLIFDVGFGASPGISRVSFAGIPFFAITHQSGLPTRQEFTISSAGLLTQNLTSEWLLTSRPDLRRQNAPFRKGWLAWNIVASTAYGFAAFTRIGPYERDTRGMADSLGAPEPWIGGLVLAPAALDTWRYFHPEARWARWTSRIVKAGAIVLIFAVN